jgi:hypothetical protein
MTTFMNIWACVLPFTGSPLSVVIPLLYEPVVLGVYPYPSLILSLATVPFDLKAGDPGGGLMVLSQLSDATLVLHDNLADAPTNTGHMHHVFMWDSDSCGAAPYTELDFFDLVRMAYPT